MNSARLHDPMLSGTLFSIGAAVGYTLSNVSLKAVSHCDPFLVTAVKAIPTVALAGPGMIWLACRGKAWAPSKLALPGLLFTALWGHWGGNVAFQWSLGVVGMALAVPLTTGAMILGSTWLGGWLLGERVTARNWLSMLLMIVAIGVLSAGAPEANRALNERLGEDSEVVGASEGGASDAARGAETTPDRNGVAASAARPIQPPLWQVALGVLAACEAGLAYAALGVSIRFCSSQKTPVCSTLTIVAFVGLVTIGAMTHARLGWAGIAAVSPHERTQMLLAGLWNAGAFYALTKALHWSPVFYVNAINSSQIGMAGLAGVLLFQEAPTWALGLGIAITTAALLLLSRK